MLAKGTNVKRNKATNMNRGNTKRNVVIKNALDTMDRGTGTIIMVVAITARNITAVIGVHGDHGMTTEATTVVITEMVDITKEMEVCISNLRMKTDVLYFQLGDSLLTTLDNY